ncbi:MAG TPA: L,D-transpeptidase family protein [Candidatus Binatia bacterium]
MKRAIILVMALVLASAGSPSLGGELQPKPEIWSPGTEVYAYGTAAIADATARAATIIGRAATHRVEPGESLLDVARRYHLGYQELIDANPEVDPWVPPVGMEIQIPSVWILPREKARGFVLNIPEMRLYYYLPDSKVMTFPLGVGMEGWDTPAGTYWIGEKRKDPVWYVPASIQHEMEQPRKAVPPGPDNPLGSYWMRLSKTTYGIHGTNNPWAVGRNVTHGCIRLYPEDIAYLFPRVPPKTPVEVVYQYTKVGFREGKAYFQVHRHRGKEDAALFMGLMQQVYRMKLAVDVRALRELVRTAPDGAIFLLPPTNPQQY